TLAASLAFMLPVATPPNAIIFGTGRLRIMDMVKTGVLLNMIAVLITTLVTYFWGTLVFKIDVHSFPEWATTLTGSG
ncbi:anion permease, partial [Pseudomonadota bacterium]